MPNRTVLVICIALATLITSCSKKQTPQTANTATTKPAEPGVKKVEVKKTPVAIPKVIVVNDSVAKKNIDGRLYYDLQGHRYWRNYDDGKYYLFNQSMYTDKAFKPH